MLCGSIMRYRGAQRKHGQFYLIGQDETISINFTEVTLDLILINQICVCSPDWGGKEKNRVEDTEDIPECRNMPTLTLSITTTNLTDLSLKRE